MAEQKSNAVLLHKTANTEDVKNKRDSPVDEDDVTEEALVAQDLFLRYKNRQLELQFMEFLWPKVSASLIFILILIFVTFVLFYRTINENGGMRPALSALIVGSIFASGIASIWQVVVVLLNRIGIAERVGTLNQQSEWLMVAVALVTGVTFKTAISLATTREKCADAQLYFYKSSGEHGVYDEALCERNFATYSVMMVFFVAVRRQRFVTVVALSVLVVLASVILALLLPTHQSFPAYHWLTVVMYVGMLLFASFFRNTLETSERRYFEAQLRLRSKRQLLEKLSSEDETFMASLLPPTTINRSSRAAARTVDQADDAIVVVFSIADFTRFTSELMAMELYTQLLMLHNVVVGHAEGSGLHKVLSLNDRLVLVGNLIERRDPLRMLLTAIDVALSSVAFIELTLRLRAAIAIGTLRGGFHGGSWIRYDIEGAALDEADAAVQHATGGQLVLTDMAYTSCREHSVVREAVDESDTADGSMLWLVESCASPEAVDGIAEVVVSTEESSSRTNTHPLHATHTSRSSLTGLRAVAKATRNAAVDEEALAEESTWLMFRRFVDPEVENEYVEGRMVTMVQRAARVWCAFAWLQLVFVVILVSDFFPASGEPALILMCVSIGLSVVVALVPTFLSRDRMSEYHTPWSLLALFVPLLTTMAMAASRPSALGADVRPVMMVGALLRVPCLYHERHQLIVIPVFIILSQLSYLLPGSAFSLWSIPYIAVALYVIVTSSEGDHAQRRNFVAERQVLLTVEALERQHHMRSGLIRATLPTPIFNAFLSGSGVLSKDTASLVPDTLAVCVSARQAFDELTIKVSDRIGFTTERLLPVERAAQESGVLHIVKVVGDLCVLVSPIAVPGEDQEALSHMTMAALPAVLRVLLELCSSGRYGALLDIDTSIQVMTTSGLPSYTVLGVVLTRLLTIAAASDAWSGFSTLERNMAGLRASSGDLAVVEQPQPPLRIRGVGMLRLVKLSL